MPIRIFGIKVLISVEPVFGNRITGTSQTADLIIGKNDPCSWLFSGDGRVVSWALLRPVMRVGEDGLSDALATLPVNSFGWMD